MSDELDLGVSTAGIHWSAKFVDGLWVARSEAEVDPILDRNKAMAAHNDGYSPDKTFRRVATLPFALIQYWKEVEGWDAMDADNHDKLVKVLNDPEYSWLRTAPGHIGYSNGVMR